MEGINVVSMFDGIRSGYVALERVGIEVKNYFASEIDKHALVVADKNYPDAVNLGDVRHIAYGKLPKIDLLIGGSPCQSFSFAGKRAGMSTKENVEILDLETYLDFKRQGFEFKGQSYLFWEFVYALRELKPKYFLLENVRMSKKWLKVINDALGIEPIAINSKLVSAQNRYRNYWTNIPFTGMPKDRGIVLKDITEEGMFSLGLAQRGRYGEDGKIKQCYELNGGEKSNCLTAVSKDSLIFIPVDRHESKSGLICLGGVMKPTHKLWLNDGKILQRNFSQGNRVYSDEGKSATLTANGGGLGGSTGLYEIGGVIRKLTRRECERLQTLPDGYTDGVSEAQAKKALGNGWTVDVIAHFFKGLKNVA